MLSPLLRDFNAHFSGDLDDEPVIPLLIRSDVADLVLGVVRVKFGDGLPCLQGLDVGHGAVDRVAADREKQGDENPREPLEVEHVVTTTV